MLKKQIEMLYVSMEGSCFAAAMMLAMIEVIVFE